MTRHDDLKAGAAAAEALLVALLSIPAVIHFFARARLFRARGYTAVSGLYEDRDGEATEASTHEYSDLLPRVGSWLSSALGMAASIVAGILYQRGGSSSGLPGFMSRWADVVAWVSTIDPLLMPFLVR